MSRGVHVNSAGALEDLALALSSFTSDCREWLEACEAQIERQAGRLEDRCRALARRVEALQDAYDEADEDDDRGEMAYRLREAEEEYERARHWLRRVEECAGEYARAAARVREVSDRGATEACAFLRQKVSELNDYVAVKPGGGAFVAAPPAGASDSAAPAGQGERAAERGLKALLGPDRYDHYAQMVEARRAADGSTRDIPAGELIAIYGYTEDDYKPINEALRSQDPARLREYAPQIEAMKAGLARLPDFAGVVFRRTWLGPVDLAHYRAGGTVTERGFTSATAATYLEYSGNVHYVIRSRKGKDISRIANTASEKEVLFPPGTRFKVSQVDRDPGGVTKIYMSEV